MTNLSQYKFACSVLAYKLKGWCVIAYMVEYQTSKWTKAKVIFRVSPGLGSNAVTLTSYILCNVTM